MVKKNHDEQAREPDWLKQHRNWTDATGAVASEVDQLRREAEAKFKAELEAVPVVGNMSPTAKDRTDDIGFLMQVFATGRFLPEHWQKFSLPNLAKESQWLDLGTRVASLEKILTQDEFRRFSDKVEGVCFEWTKWRKRAIAEQVEKMTWDKWAETHADLKSEWEEVTWWINELQRYLQKLAAVVDERTDKPAQTNSNAESELGAKPNGEKAKDGTSHKRPLIRQALRDLFDRDTKLKKKYLKKERLKKGQLDDLVGFVNKRLESVGQPQAANKDNVGNARCVVKKDWDKERKMRP